MIQLSKPLALSSTDLSDLANLQTLVDLGSTYEDQVKIAFQKWQNKPKSLFQNVKTALDLTCPGARRCGYCEDSLADEIEHIRPKNWFPDQTFDPNNFLYSCGPCNGPKNNAYAVVDKFGTLIEAKRMKEGAVLPPPVGQEALLHPRFDDPAKFFYLDLEDTFNFEPHSSLSPEEKSRAEFTKRILRINKDTLSKARKEAFYDFACRIKNYYIAIKENEEEAHLNLLRNELLSKQHITVWREMQKQSNQLIFLKRLFALVPEAVKW